MHYTVLSVSYLRKINCPGVAATAKVQSNGRPLRVAIRGTEKYVMLTVWSWAQPLAHPAHQHVFERRHRTSDDLGVLRHALGLRRLRFKDDSTKLELQFRVAARARQRELKS